MSVEEFWEVDCARSARSVYILTELITGGELHGAIRETGQLNLWLGLTVREVECRFWGAHAVAKRTKELERCSMRTI